MLTQGEMSGCTFVVVSILEITSIPFVWGQIKNEAVYHLVAATLSKMEKVVDYVYLFGVWQKAITVVS